MTCTPPRLGVALLLLCPGIGAAQGSSYVHFESGPVHPLRVSADGSLLYVANTPDNHLSIYSLADPGAPYLVRDVPVGLEPVSVALRGTLEAWVANSLSDTVSIVSASSGHVTETIYVGDEPADIVFAGDPELAFVTVSARDEVQVFDAATRSHVQTIPIFGRDPKAMVASASGDKVYVLVLRSGNRTTILDADLAPPPPPPTNQSLPDAPAQGLIVRDDDPTWSPLLNTTLLDHDIVEIDVATLAITRTFSDVGTILCDLTLDPATGSLFVANTEARNLERFMDALRGHAIDSRVTKVETGGAFTVTPWNLNPGIDYSTLPNTAALASALSEPMGILFDSVNQVLYVTARGTDRLAVVSPADGTVQQMLEMGEASGATIDTLNKRGPRALELHPSGPWLYVLNQLSSSLAVVNTQTLQVVNESALSHDPMPTTLSEGRKFLYDAKLSGNGTLSCGACHVDGEWDGLAWDLGEPDGDMLPGPPAQPFPFDAGLEDYHPMKGPMTTQTLRGLAGTAPHHWRGDFPTLDTFQSAFTGVLGGAPLDSADIARLSAFLDGIALPPNPNQHLDGSLPSDPPQANAESGAVFFEIPQVIVQGVGVSCATCHELPLGSTNFVVGDFFPNSSFTDLFKVPTLRTVYRRNNPDDGAGNRKLGFGLAHDGEHHDVASFLGFSGFDAWPPEHKDDLAAYLIAFDTGTPAITGHQVQLDATSVGDNEVLAELALLEAQAVAGECDVVARGTFNGALHGFTYDPLNDWYEPDDPNLAATSRSTFEAAASSGSVLVFTATPTGSGMRIGRDRDEDGTLNAADGNSVYGVSTPGCNGDIDLFANVEPTVGARDYYLSTYGFQPGKLGVLGISPALAAFPVLGVTLFVDVTQPGLELAIMTHEASGFASAHVQIPNLPSLVGETFYAQVLFKDDCGSQGWAATNGLAMTVTE